MQFRFDCVFYYVSDLERSVRSYQDVLGLKLRSRDVVARFGLDGVLVELVPSSARPIAGHGNAAYLAGRRHSGHSRCPP